MKLYYIRHQANGIVYEYPFETPPTKEQVAKVLAACETSHGKAHRKTGAPYWAKIVCVDTAKPGEFTTVGGANGESAEEIDATAARECPIRDGEIIPERDLGGPSDASTAKVGVSGRGSVRNP